MIPRNIQLPLFAAIGLALLAATIGLISVGSLHDSFEDVTRVRLQRVQHGARLEAALLRLENGQQALAAARSTAELRATRTELATAKEELAAAMEDLARVEDFEGHRRLDAFGAEVEAYLKALERLDGLAEDRHRPQPAQGARDESESAFHDYAAALDAVREWTLQMAPKAAEAPASSSPPGIELVSPPVDGDPMAAFTVPDPSSLGPVLPQPTDVDVAELQRTIADVVSAAWALRLTTDSIFVDESDDQRERRMAAEAERRVSALQTVHERLAAQVTSARPELFAAVRDSLAQWREVTAKQISLARDGTATDAYAASVDEATARLTAAHKAGLEITEAAETGAQRARDNAARTYATALWTTVPLVVLALIATVLISVWRSKTTPAAETGIDEASSLPSADEHAAPLSLEELTHRTNRLAEEAEMAALQVNELGKCYATVASEVRKLADRSQLAATELAALPVNDVDIEAKEQELAEGTLGDIEVMATLIIEISSAIRIPNVAAASNDGDAHDVEASSKASGSEGWPDVNDALDDQAKRVIEAVSRFRAASGARRRRSVDAAESADTPEVDATVIAPKNEGDRADTEA